MSHSVEADFSFVAYVFLQSSKLNLQQSCLERIAVLVLSPIFSVAPARWSMADALSEETTIQGREK